MIQIENSSRNIDREVRENLSSGQALYELNLEIMESLRPNLVVTQALCDVCAVPAGEVSDAIRQLPTRPQIINLEPSNLEDVFATIQLVATATDRVTAATALIDALHGRIARIEQTVDNQNKPRVAVLEWLDPLFSAGHWIPQLVELAGGLCVTGNTGERSRTLTWSEFIATAPEFLLIACCGLPIDRALADLPALTCQPDWAQLTCCQTDRVFVADGHSYFNRPGPRLVDSVEIVADMLHPNQDLLSNGVLPAKHWRH